MAHTGIVGERKIIKMHFVHYKVPYMNSFRDLANRLIIENPKQKLAAENGSGTKSGYF